MSSTPAHLSVWCDVNESRMASEDLSLWLVLIDPVLCEGLLMINVYCELTDSLKVRCLNYQP